jgi:hypothetical protein
VTITNFWTATLCKNYVSFLSSLPLTTTPGKPKKGDAVRVNDRFQVDDPAFAERLWSGTALKNLVLGLTETGKKKSKEPPPEPFVVGLEVGMALLHRHGAQCMLHEGREVLSGEKWVLRSDLCVRR